MGGCCGVVRAGMAAEATLEVAILAKADEAELLGAEIMADEAATESSGELELLCKAFNAARVSTSCWRVGVMASGAGAAFAFFWLAALEGGRPRFFFGCAAGAGAGAAAAAAAGATTG